VILTRSPPFDSSLVDFTLSEEKEYQTTTDLTD